MSCKAKTFVMWLFTNNKNFLSVLWLRVKDILVMAWRVLSDLGQPTPPPAAHCWAPYLLCSSHTGLSLLVHKTCQAVLSPQGLCTHCESTWTVQLLHPSGLCPKVLITQINHPLATWYFLYYSLWFILHYHLTYYSLPSNILLIYTGFFICPSWQCKFHWEEALFHSMICLTPRFSK